MEKFKTRALGSSNLRTTSKNLTSPEKPNPEGSLVCQICFENFNGNWGLVHGRTMHAGYCEGCAEKLKKDKLPCP